MLHCRVLLIYLNLKAGKILDIGCGPGWLLSSLSSDWKKYGNEADEYAIKLSDDNKIKFSNIDVQNGVYEENYFDVIVMHHVIEHVPNPNNYILAVKKILKPGATLIIGTPDFDSGCARLFSSKYRLLHDPTHISLFSNDSMHRFILKS